MSIQRRLFLKSSLSFAAAALLSNGKHAIAASSPVETGVIKVGDAHIEYFSQGKGTAVVLLPGGSLTVGYMEGLAEALVDAGFRAVRINPRGAGKSTGPSNGITMHSLAADVAGVIEALHLAPVHVAGHAFGNRVARTLDADRPDLVKTVTLFACGGKVEPQPAAVKALKIIFSPTSSESEILAAMTYMVGNPAEVKPAWKIVEPCHAPQAGAIEFEAGKNTPLNEWWAPAGKAKYLLLQGANDQAAPPANAQMLKQELGERATLVMFPGAGHLLLVTEPKKATESMVAFLR